MSDDVTTTPEGGADPSDVGALHQEAAKRRRQVRALESTVAERDETIATLQARVDAGDRAAVEKAVGDRLADPADLWLGHSLEDFRGEDGEVDAERVTAAVDALLESKPHWGQRAVPDLHVGVRPLVPGKPSFGEHLKQGIGGR